MKASRLGRIIIAEDDQAIASMICELLGDAGYVVEPMHDGASALLAVRADPPRLLLLDIGLPVMTGDEVLKALRCAGFWQLSIVVTSAGSNTAKYLGLGANAVLPKPYGLDDLLAIVNKHVH